VRWDKGGEAILTSMDADVLRLRSQVAYPPGARILGDALARPPYRLKMKIHSSRREADGLFAIEARAVDWTRPMREWVAEALAAGAPGRAAK
jgi:hypothetical protein